MFFKALVLFLLLLLRQSLIGSTQNTVVSMGKSTGASSIYVSGSISYGPKRAVDGDTQTNFNLGSCFRSIQGTSHWWSVSLGDLYSVDYVNIYKADGFEGTLIGTSVRISQGSVATTGNTTLCGSIQSAPTGAFYTVDCNPSKTGNYVTLAISGANTQLVVCEVEVFGVLYSKLPVVTCPDDIIFGTSLSQSTQLVTWDPPTVTDDVDIGLTAACMPSSGSSFTVSTTVACTAIDSNGNIGSCTFSVQIIVDNQAPSISCPGDMTVFITASQTMVTWDTLVSDNTNYLLSTMCSPSSGTIFPVSSSPTTVICTATDNAGNQRTCQFTVTVIQDTTEPIVVCPDVETTTVSNQTIVTWDDPTATDNVDNSPSINCSHPSPSIFIVGSTDVTCSATDDAGNIGSCTFTITVTQTGSPILICPDDINMDTNTTNTIVTWNDPSVTDDVDTDLSAVCSPSSGSLFPIGSTPVTCTATDSAGNNGRCTFLVQVNDSRNPTVTCPDIQMSTSTSKATVTWDDLFVTDNIDIGLSAVCSPSSGSSFPVGSTVVTCTATDNAGNEGICTFTVSDPTIL